MPQTEKPTWLADFCLQCVGTVAIVCIESCIVSYLVTKKGDIPTCAIRFSKSYLYVIHGSGGKPRDTGMDVEGNANTNTIEMSTQGDEENLVNTHDGSSSNSSNSTIGSTSKTTSDIRNGTKNPLGSLESDIDTDADELDGVHAVESESLLVKHL